MNLTGVLDIVPIVDGEDGNDGQNATVYELEADPNVVTIDPARTLIVTVTVRAFKREGSGARTAYSGGTLIRQALDSNGNVITGSTASVAASSISFNSNIGNNSASTFKVTLSIAGATEKILYIPVSLYGKRDRFCGYWNSTTTYYDTDEVCDNVVRLFSDGTEQAYERKGGGSVIGTPPESDSAHWNMIETNPKTYFKQVLAIVIQAQDGSFDYLTAENCDFNKVTIRGVINNLIVNITSANANNYGYHDTTYSYFYLNPLKTGCMVYYGITSNIILPIAFYDGTDTVLEWNGHTLQELRQCVGKVFYFVNQTNAQQTSNWYKFYAGTSGMRLLAQNVKQYSVGGGTKYDWDLQGVINQTPPDGYGGIPAADIHPRVIMCNNAMLGWGYYFVKIECKLGMYNSRECIYWEIEGCGNRLEQPT